MKTVIYDLETQSLCDLRTAGGYLYATHPSTRVILLCAKLPDGTTQAWRPLTQPRPDWMDKLNGACLVAHNGFHFDHLFLDKLEVTPGELRDSMYAAFTNCLRGSLEQSSRTQFDLEKAKDKTGYQVMKTLATPFKGQLLWPNALQLNALEKYGRQDVELCSKLYDALDYPDEPELIEADRAINQRGFTINRELCQKILHQEMEESAHANRTVEEETNGIKARSIKLREWLSDEGVDVADLRAKTVERLLRDSDLPDAVRTVLSAKTQASANTGSKLSKMLERSDIDGVVRYTMMAYGAHTGRWAGRGVQPHNFPRVKPHDKFIDEVYQQDTWTTEERKMMLRTCIQARPGKKFFILDFASIEARVLAWLGGEQEVLDQYAQDHDYYIVMASKIFGVSPEQVTGEQRAVGKVLVLGAGYGLGGARLSDYASAYMLNLAAMGLDSYHLIEQFRDARQAIAGVRTGAVIPPRGTQRFGLPRTGGLWKDYDKAFRNALEGHDSRAGRCVFRQRGTTGVDIELPSGRCLAYRRCVELGDGRRPQIAYQRSAGIFSKIYGGKITENIDQAIGRDLLGALLVRAEELPEVDTVLHVHDELVLEVPEEWGADRLHNCSEWLLDATPYWAAGLPVGIEGFTSKWYTKAVPRDSIKINAKVLK